MKKKFLISSILASMMLISGCTDFVPSGFSSSTDKNSESTSSSSSSSISSSSVPSTSSVSSSSSSSSTSSENKNSQVISSSSSVTQGFAGDILEGDFVVIINSNTAVSQKRSTGTLNFSLGDLSSDETYESVDQNLVSKEYKTLKYTGNNYEPTKPYVVNETTFAQATWDDPELFTLRYEGEHCYVWMEEELEKQYVAAGYDLNDVCKKAANVFDNGPYSVLAELAGTENIPYRDGTNKISIAINVQDSSGFYMSDESKTVIYINGTLSSYQRYAKYGDEYSYFDTCDDLFVHEGQHALFDIYSEGVGLSYSDYLEDFRALNEGLACLAMIYNAGGYEHDRWLAQVEGYAPLRDGESLLNYSNDSTLNYSFSFSYCRYLVDQIGGNVTSDEEVYNARLPEFFHAIYSTSIKGKTIEQFMDEVLGKFNIPGNETFMRSFINYYIAMTAREDTGIYGFYNDEVIEKEISQYPLYYGKSGRSVILDGRAAITIELPSGKFKVPTDGELGIVYYVVKNSSLRSGAIEESGVATAIDVLSLPSTDTRVGEKIDFSEVLVQITYESGGKSKSIGPDELDKYGIHFLVMYSRTDYDNDIDVNDYTLRGYNAQIYVYVGVPVEGDIASEVIDFVCYMGN